MDSAGLIRNPQRDGRAANFNNDSLKIMIKSGMCLHSRDQISKTRNGMNEKAAKSTFLESINQSIDDFYEYELVCLSLVKSTGWMIFALVRGGGMQDFGIISVMVSGLSQGDKRPRMRKELDGKQRE